VTEKVSIILPTYNGSKYIRQSIDSCLNQTYKNIELIVVDDCSTDDTAAIVKSYKNERVKYLRHETNRSLPIALNTGFAKATGEYLTWTSHDNYYDVNAVEKMFNFLKERDCSFVYCNFYRFNTEDPSSLTMVRLPDTLELGKQNVVGACCLYSRRVKDIVGDYDPDVFLAEDYDYWIRVSRKFLMCHNDEFLYFYREHNRSLTQSRQQEIGIATILVRIKNNVLDINQATRLVTSLIALNYMAYPNLTPSFRVNRLIRTIFLYQICRFLVSVRFSRRNQKILGAFRQGRIGFQNTKSCLLGINIKLNGRKY
jgi:glycosyltransferase involved in cell wall biosynthesis